MLAWLRAIWRHPIHLVVTVLLVAALALTIGFIQMSRGRELGKSGSLPTRTVPGASPSPSKDPSGNAVASSLPSFRDDFQNNGTLEEAGEMRQSSNPAWWLNSGGILAFRGGYAQTIQGSLPTGAKWQREYASSSTEDTDGGRHPQNLFRLVTRSRYQQMTQEVFFRVDADQLSKSSHREVSNGLLLFNRYQNGDNLYYTGLRVDGHAVIKKKKDGDYYTMAEKQVLPGTYNRTSQPNLLPKHTWIGLRSQVMTRPDGQVEVQLWSDLGRPGAWQQLLSTTDDGHQYGGLPINSSGYGGIRTDFMDVSFRGYSISERPH